MSSEWWEMKQAERAVIGRFVTLRAAKNTILESRIRNGDLELSRDVLAPSPLLNLVYACCVFF